MPNNISFLEGKDYDFIEDLNFFSCASFVEIKFPTSNDTYQTWKLAILNEVITTNKEYVKSIVNDYMTIHGHDISEYEYKLISNNK